MERLLTCDACGEKIVVANKQAGQQVVCSKCNHSNQVPRLRELSLLPPLEAPQEYNSSTKSDTWSWRGPVVALSLLGVILGLWFSGYQSYVWYMTRTNFTPQMHVEYELELVEKVPLDSLLTLWDDFSKMPLGPKRPPEYKLLNDLSATSFKKGTLGGILTLALLTTAIFVARSAKRSKSS